jgi:hypothetical protein
MTLIQLKMKLKKIRNDPFCFCFFFSFAAQTKNTNHVQSHCNILQHKRFLSQDNQVKRNKIIFLVIKCANLLDNAFHEFPRLEICNL